MSATGGRRAFGVRGAVLAFGALSFAALAFASCGADKPGGAPTTGVDAGPIELVAVGGPAGSVLAEVFFNEPGAGPQSTCAAPVNAGACRLTSCQLGGVGDPVMGYGDFGPVFATVGTTTVPLTYNGFAYPTVYFPASVALGTGGIMKFHGGDGASVPTFDVAATIPGLPLLTSPVTTDGSAVIIDTSQDLSVTWVPISIGHIFFEIYGGVPSGGDVELTVLCSFEGASGSGVVPQALLPALKAMSATIPLSAALGSELDAATVVDGLTIVTESHQGSPTTGYAFGVAFQ
jgi:hypothetical protein